jgi:hypothetical protein
LATFLEKGTVFLEGKKTIIVMINDKRYEQFVKRYSVSLLKIVV